MTEIGRLPTEALEAAIIEYELYMDTSCWTGPPRGHTRALHAAIAAAAAPHLIAEGRRQHWEEMIDLHESKTWGVRTCQAADGTLLTPDHLCPDLLRYSQIGAADGPRGRVVRGFFWLLRVWPVR